MRVIVVLSAGVLAWTLVILGFHLTRRDQILPAKSFAQPPLVSDPTTKNGLSLTISTERQHYEVGDLIAVPFTLTNVSTKPQIVCKGSGANQSWSLA